MPGLCSAGRLVLRRCSAPLVSEEVRTPAFTRSKERAVGSTCGFNLILTDGNMVILDGNLKTLHTFPGL